MSDYPAWSAFQSLVRESYYNRVTAGAVAFSAKAALAEQAERAEQAEAALAERDRMLRLAWERFPYICEAGGEPHAATLDTFLTFYRARATTPEPEHICYLCHQPIRLDQESEEWEPGYRHFECPARAEDGSET